jgi:hypothetical protein
MGRYILKNIQKYNFVMVLGKMIDDFYSPPPPPTQPVEREGGE